VGSCVYSHTLHKPCYTLHTPTLRDVMLDYVHALRDAGVCRMSESLLWSTVCVYSYTLHTPVLHDVMLYYLRALHDAGVCRMSEERETGLSM